jgi:hypothetical protein
MDTLLLSVDQINAWQTPEWQRPIRANSKVMALAEEMKQTQTIVGVITLGHMSKDNASYVVDGQHRIEAFRISGLTEVIADIRVVHFDTMAEMADEFVKLNTAIKRMRPDDMLRGLAPNLPNLQRVMRECPFVGYTHVRRKGHSGSLVNLASVLRCWQASINDTPSSGSSSMSITQIAAAQDNESTANLIKLLSLMSHAWGSDPEYFKLWGNLNMTICMWLYRRMVLDTTRRGSQRVSILTDTQFKQCLGSLSASSSYMDWLVGRLLNDRDRSPALVRIKTIFVRRLIESGVAKPYLPSPSWASK